MKWVYKTVLGLLVVLTIAAAAGSLYFYSRVNDNNDMDAAYEFRNYPDYYFSLILNTEDDIYWKDFKEGATDAAKRYTVAIEFNEVPEPESRAKTIEYIRIANQSKMDGIVVAGDISDEFNDAINEATDSEINVISCKYDIPENDRAAYVGTNSYEFGVDAAKLIGQLSKDGETVDVAIILSEDYVQNGALYPSTQNIMTGMSEDPVNIVSTLNGTSGLLGAEDQIRTTLTKHPDIDVILCTNAKDTISAVNVVRERNLFGKVFIVGTGMTDQIIDYIKKGVIFGVIDRKGYEAGYQSVLALYESMGGTFSNKFKDINTNTYTAQNISSYVKP